MLYGPPGKQSLVSPEFNQMCVEAGVEARVQPLPNPGTPTQAMRVITFKNFNKENQVTVIQRNKKKSRYVIQPKGELQIMLQRNEELPFVAKGIIDG